MRDGDVGLSQRETRRKLEDDGHLRHRGSRRRGSDEGLVCHVRRCRKQRGHRLLSGILDLTPRCTLLSNMNETLIYTDTRPRARSTGHAFGFEGNLGMPVVISGMLSVFILTMLLNGDNGMPLLAKFLLALLPHGADDRLYHGVAQPQTASIRSGSSCFLGQRSIVSAGPHPAASSVHSTSMIDTSSVAPLVPADCDIDRRDSAVRAWKATPVTAIPTTCLIIAAACLLRLKSAAGVYRWAQENRARV